jgi:hypothetical protein
MQRCKLAVCHFQPGASAIKNCRVTLHFVTFGIKAWNNFTLQFKIYKKSAHGMILIILSFSDKKKL